MPKPFDRADAKIDVEPKSSYSASVIEEQPFRILLMGDFSGRASRGVMEPLRSRKPLMIDRDNFDSVMARLEPALGKSGQMKFQELDDFHPDRIFGRLEIFGALRETRRRLEDPETFQATAREISPGSAPQPDIGRLIGGNLLDEMLQATSSRAAGAARARDPFSEEVRRLVAPYLTPRPDPKQAEMVVQLDAAISGHMAQILHHSAFQALEAAWRAVYLLVRRLETNELLKVYLLDVSRQEMVRDLDSTTDLRATGLYKILVEDAVRTPGEQPWALIAGDFTFGPTVPDVGVLARLGMLARQARAPFLAAGDPLTVGSPGFENPGEVSEWSKNITADAEVTWDFLRGLPEAAFVGLALPRFLARLPYGAETDACERFAFEEMPGKPVHSHYLWANPAFACVLLLGETFSRSGWDMRPGDVRKITGLPLHTYKEDGAVVMKACAEAFFTETAAEAMIERGLMPFVSYKNQDVIQLLRFQSVAKPERPLAGRWV